MSVTSRATGAPGATVRGLLQRLPPPLDAAAVVALLRRNKYPLLSLDPATLPEGLAGAPAFQRALAEERAFWASQREEYLQVREAWAQRGIPCLFIKTACIPPSFPYTSDNLDILVHREQGEEAKAVLRELGYLELRNVEERCKFLFRKFRDGRSVSAVHLHYWVGWNINFFEEEALWEGARVAPDDPAVLAPSPEDALLINLAHAFYENKRFTLHDLEKVRVNWERHELEWEALAEVPRRRGWHDGLLLGLLLTAHLEEALTGATEVPEGWRRRWDEELRRYPHAHRYLRRLLERPVTMPFRVGFLFSKLLYYQKIWRDTHDSLPAKAATTARTLVWGFKLKSGIRPNRGMLVAFSGLDGSGKTLQAQALARVLKTCDIAHSSYWSRVGCSPFTRLVSRVVQRRSTRGKGPAPDWGGPRENLSRWPGFVQAAWAWLMVLDLAVRYTLRVRLPLWRGRLGLGKVVVCDRYALDAAAEVLARASGGGWAVRLAVAFLRVASPRPTQAYLLDVPEPVAQARHALPISTQRLAEYRRWYLSLGPAFGARVEDGQRGAGELGDETAARVVREFQARYPTWLNGLLLSNPRQLNPKGPAQR